MTRVAFLLFDGFSNMVLSCLLEPLRAVRDQAQIDIRWQVLTPDGQPVRSSSGLSIAPYPETAEPFDMLVVVAGYGPTAAHG
jgi:transcriptional regulator GlxA family with amidase domain